MVVICKLLFLYLDKDNKDNHAAAENIEPLFILDLCDDFYPRKWTFYVHIVFTLWRQL